jgi:hypothetical protein
MITGDIIPVPTVGRVTISAEHVSPARRHGVEIGAFARGLTFLE